LKEGKDEEEGSTGPRQVGKTGIMSSLCHFVVGTIYMTCWHQNRAQYQI